MTQRVRLRVHYDYNKGATASLLFLVGPAFIPGTFRGGSVDHRSSLHVLRGP